MAECAICGAEMPNDIYAKDGKCEACWRKLFPPSPFDDRPQWTPSSNSRRQSGIDYSFPNDDHDEDDDK